MAAARMRPRRCPPCTRCISSISRCAMGSRKAPSIAFCRIRRVTCGWGPKTASTATMATQSASTAVSAAMSTGLPATISGRSARTRRATYGWPRTAAAWPAGIGGRNNSRRVPARRAQSRTRWRACDAVRTLLIDPRGRIWVGTLDQGLDVLDPKTGDVRHFRHREGDPHSLAADAVCALYADHRGRIWIGTDGGLSRYEPASEDFVTILRHDRERQQLER